MNRSILKLAIPNIVSNITIPLLGLVGGSIKIPEMTDHVKANIYVTEKFIGKKFNIDGNLISI